MTDKPRVLKLGSPELDKVLACPTFAPQLDAALTAASPPPKTHAEVAKAICSKHIYQDEDKHGEFFLQVDGPELREAIATALREAGVQARKDHVEACGLEFVMGHHDFRIAAPKDHILDDAGNVRRVEGHGLAISADGVVLTPGARVWRGNEEDHDDGSPFEGWVVLSLEGGERERSRFSWVMLNGIGEATTQNLYSTREAALHAKDAHAGE